MSLRREEVAVRSASVLDHIAVAVAPIPLPGAGTRSRRRIGAVHARDADRPLHGQLPGTVLFASDVPVLGISIVLEVGVVRCAAVAGRVEELDGNAVVVGDHQRLWRWVRWVDARHPLAGVKRVIGGPRFVPIASYVDRI